MNLELLPNSLLVSASSTALALLFGGIVALWAACLGPRLRAVILAVSVLVLALPPFFVTGCWLELLGFTGTWHKWLPLNIYSLGGTVWVMALLIWPVSMLLMWAGWQRLDAAQLESDTALTGGTLLRRLLLPLAYPNLILAIIITFVLALNNFTVPAILQTKVFPAEIWVDFNTTFDYVAALKSSCPVILVPLLLVLFLRADRVSWPAWSAHFPAAALKRQIGQSSAVVLGVSSLIILWLSCGLPVWELISAERTWKELPGAFAAGQGAIWHSFMMAAVTATLVLAVSIYSRKYSWGRALWLFYWIPGVLTGIVIIFLLNRPPFIAFYQSVGVVLLALLLRYAAFGWQGLRMAAQQVDINLNDAALLSGATSWQLLARVQFPQVFASLSVTWYIVYLLALWDVETIVLIMPPGGETLASRVFHLLHYGHNAQVNALCLLLLSLAVLPLVLWRVGNVAMRRLKPALAISLMVGCVLFSGCQPPSNGEEEIQSRIFSRVQVIGTRGAGIGQFNKPRSVGVDGKDNMYAVDITGRVQKFSPQGTFLLSWQMPQTDRGKPKGMCMDEKGNVIVVEPHYSRVNHYDPNGKLVSQWGVAGTNAGQLIFPRSAAVNAKGEVYVSEYGLVERIQKFSAQGKEFLMSFGHGGEGPGELNRAEGVGLDPAGNLYVADSCNHRVQVFTGDGKFIRSFGHAGSGPGEMSYPYDVRVDKEGRQYVCEFGNSRIQIFDANGSLIEILGGPGGEPGKFSNPWSITLDSAGNLYVADAGNHRVQKFIRRPGNLASAKSTQ